MIAERKLTETDSLGVGCRIASYHRKSSAEMKTDDLIDFIPSGDILPELSALNFAVGTVGRPHIRWAYSHFNISNVG